MSTAAIEGGVLGVVAAFGFPIAAHADIKAVELARCGKGFNMDELNYLLLNGCALLNILFEFLLDVVL